MSLRAGQQLKIVNNLNKNINKKINKIKNFYDKRINNIYERLKNKNDVEFVSLYEINRPPDNVNFNENDFDEVGAMLVKNIPSYSIGAKWFMAATYLVMAALSIIFAFIFYRFS